MKAAWVAAFAVGLILLGIGILQWLSRPPQGEPIRLLPPPTPSPLVIHVAGAVNQPGVYELPQGGRVRDAIDAAGGLSPSANAQAINLAALLSDGQRIVVPTLPAPQNNADQSKAVQALPVYPLDINTATQEELETLPGIGPITADKIINYRQEQGPFKNIEGLLDVPGIGPVTLEKIKDLIQVMP